MRVLLIPGSSRDALAELVEFIAEIIGKVDRLFIIGFEETIRDVGRSIPRNILRTGKIAFYKVSRLRDPGEQALRIIVETTPTVIVLFGGGGQNGSLNSSYFTALGRMLGSRIIVYTRDQMCHSKSQQALVANSLKILVSTVLEGKSHEALDRGSSVV